MAQRPKRRKRRSGRENQPRKGGMMIGMRRGFKKAASSVVGSGEKQQKSAGRSWMSTAFTVLLLVAAVAFLFYRWR